MAPWAHPKAQAWFKTLFNRSQFAFMLEDAGVRPVVLKGAALTATIYAEPHERDCADLDLLVTHEWGPVRLWRNTDDVLVDDTEAAGLAGLTGWWNGVAAGDPDHDGDLDYVVTNLGLGSRNEASPDTRITPSPASVTASGQSPKTSTPASVAETSCV